MVKSSALFGTQPACQPRQVQTAPVTLQLLHRSSGRRVCSYQKYNAEVLSCMRPIKRKILTEGET